MTINLVTQGEEIHLDLTLSTNKQLKLYRNDVTAGLTASQIKALTESSFTEANFTGYAAKTLTGGSWTTTQGDPTTGTYAQQTFTRTATGADQTIYGYYVVRSSDGKLEWFEDFTGPIITNTNGDAIVITPTYTLDDDQEATVAARGIMASQTFTTASVNYTADGTSDFALSNFDADGTRVYRIHITSPWNLTVATGFWVAIVQIDGVNFARMGHLQGASVDEYLSSSVLWEPATGQYDLTIHNEEISGSATLQYYADATSPRSFWIEDIGPA